MLKTLGIAATLGRRGSLGGKPAKLGDSIPADVSLNYHPSQAAGVGIVLVDSQASGKSQEAKYVAPAPVVEVGVGGDGVSEGEASSGDAGGDGSGAAGDGSAGDAGSGAGPGPGGAW